MKRGSYSPEFKAKVAMEAITTNNIRQTALRNGLDSQTVTLWREKLLTHAPELFVLKPKTPPRDTSIEYKRRKTYRETNLATAILHVFSQRRNRHNKHARIRPLPQKPVQRIEYKTPPYPKEYIKSLPEKERAQADFLYRTYLEMPWMGAKRLSEYVQVQGYDVGKTRIETYLRNMGLQTVYPMNSSRGRKLKKRQAPYLIKDMPIFMPNQVWSTDITYITSLGYNLYLSIVIDWYSRKLLSWHFSDRLVASCVIENIQDAIDKYGTPAIINSDQGLQYCSNAYREFLKEKNIRQSMNLSRRRYIDNIMAERWFRSLKNELIYLKDFKNFNDLKRAIGKYVEVYNTVRPHTSFKFKTPDRIYYSSFSNAPVTDEKYQQKLNQIEEMEKQAKRPEGFQEKLVWPEETVKTLITEFESGENIFKLSKKYGHAWATIFSLLEENGVDVSDERMQKRKIQEYRRNRKYSTKEIAQLYKEGKTIEEICSVIGVGKNTVSKALNEEGVKIRISADYRRKNLKQEDTDNN